MAFDRLAHSQLLGETRSPRPGDAVKSHSEVLVSAETVTRALPMAVGPQAVHSSAVRTSQPVKPTAKFSDGVRRPCHLYDIACARSGDKGTSANVGVIARSHDCW